MDDFFIPIAFSTLIELFFVFSIFLDYHQKDNYLNGVYFIVAIFVGLGIMAYTIWKLGIFAALTPPIFLVFFLIASKSVFRSEQSGNQSENRPQSL